MFVQAVLSDPLRETLPEHAARLHTPARLPPLLNTSVRQAAAKLFKVCAISCFDVPPQLSHTARQWMRISFWEWS